MNVKRPLSILSPVKSFRPDLTKVRLTVQSPNTFRFRQSKEEGYEARLFWQFQYCQDNDGQTFYYTLTYNDDNIPTYLGRNCFDYEDLRDLFTGGFRKKLLRDYGTRFKYFVGAELGEGAGERGMHNNPHYHVLFFLEPFPHDVTKTVIETVPVGVYVRNTKLHKRGEVKYRTVRRKVTKHIPYKKILPEHFRYLVKSYWQGFDETVDGFRDYRTAKYGIAKEGDFCGLVQDFRAISYVSKYCAKDVGLKQSESQVYKHWLELYSSEDFSEDLYKSFFYDWLYQNCNFQVETAPNEFGWFFEDWQLRDYLLGDYDDKSPDCPSIKVIDFVREVPIIIRQNGFEQDFSLWKSSYIDGLVQERVSEYRNRFCNKTRISDGVGDYALSFIDKDEPTVTVPKKKGFKARPISLYYYRKLYTDYYVDKDGSVIRFLNSDGVEYKRKRILSSLQKRTECAYHCLELVHNNPDLYTIIFNSDVNDDVTTDYNQFETLLESLPLSDITVRYAEYKLIYEGRFFPYYPVGSSRRCHFPVVNPLYDYERFTQPFFYLGSADLRVPSFLERGCKNHLAYDAHPYFLRYTRLFHIIDLVSDYLDIQKDNKQEDDEAERRKLRKFHKQSELKQYYDNFKCP